MAPAAVLLSLALAACGPLPRPFQAILGAESNPLVAPEESLVVRVEAVDGPPLPLARLLAGAVAEALGALDVAAVARDTGTSRYVLKGRAEVNRDNHLEPYMVLIDWSIVDSAGDVIGLHTQGVEGTWVEWEYGDPGLVRAVGKAAAKPIAALIVGEEAPAAPAALTAALLFGPVRGAPGDGDRSLARAMRLALKATDVRVTEHAAKATHSLRGTVSVTPPAAGRQRVRVVWTVTTAGGKEVARLTQVSAVPGGSVDGPWGRLAAEIAAAVVADIESVLDAATGKRR